MKEESKQVEKEQLARGVVARGRTVQVPHPTEMIIVGTNPETGVPIRAPRRVEYGPGQEVTLTKSEINNLRSTGFLIDPDKLAGGEPAEGSHVSETTAT